ncbi:MAG: hypothetical protein HY901_27455 [Deltaproteobacteria bacterium]|nr:hypothetical protein [Deltaproteobacteria bacterium]
MSVFEAHTLIAGNVHVLPVLHDRLELAQLVVEAFQRLKPAALAVELPRSLEKPLLKAVKRLPQISGVRYRNAQDETVYFLVEPAEALFEAARLGLEHQVPVHCVDLDLDDYPDRFDALPDSYSVLRIGHRAFVEAWLGSPGAQRQGPEDARREAAMAARLTRLSREVQGGPLLFVCGMAHAQRIADLLGQSDVEPLDRALRSEVTLFNLHPDSCREVLGTWPFLSAEYERARALALGRKVRREAREAEQPQVINLFDKVRRKGAASPETRPAAAAEPTEERGLPVDRQRVLLDLYREAGRRYEKTTGEQLRPYHLRVYLKFLRNWSLTRGLLQPELYQIVVGARAAVDDNFAYELFQEATAWPWQKAEAELPTERVTLEDLRRGSERIRFRPRQVTRRLRALGNRRRVGDAGDWLQGFDQPFSNCSYPPEDMALERFSTYVQKKARGVLSEENKRVEPFTNSLLDGIDMRETLRNWHEGKLYVQELRKGLGAVGSVVVVFDEDRDRYPWEITWMGEVPEEGDMCLFATHPMQQIVGPGICRCEYGGFLLSYPPGRMSDVWSDEVFESARTRAERLLMAGVDYCEQKVIVYVAKKPPRPEMKSWAGRFGKKIVYLPIGQFSPDTLKKLRVFHVLFGKDKRDFAKDYIW